MRELDFVIKKAYFLETLSKGYDYSFRMDFNAMVEIKLFTIRTASSPNMSFNFVAEERGDLSAAHSW